MNTLTKKEMPDRSKINLRSAKELKSWADELGISVDRLRGVIEKVDRQFSGGSKKSPFQPDGALGMTPLCQAFLPNVAA